MSESEEEVIGINDNSKDQTIQNENLFDVKPYEIEDTE